MKKLFAITLALLLAVGCASAFAEDMFEGTWVQFEDGFEILLPNEWLELEVTDEMYEAGTFYAVMSPNAECHIQLAWAETDATEISQIATAFESVYSGVGIEESNGIEFVTYTDDENASSGIVAMDAEAGGMYIFNFTFAQGSESDFYPIANAIATSIRNIQE